MLIVSLAALIKASDWFTGTAERPADPLGIPAFVAGMTIVAIGTSLPELVASVLAVLRGTSEYVAGNVVGSNIANLLLVLGLAAIVDGHLRVRFELVHVDLPFLAGSAFFLALILWDGQVGRIEALLSLTGLAIYGWYVLGAKRSVLIEPVSEEEQAPRPAWLRTGLVLLGSAALIYAGANYTVRSIVEIAELVGLRGGADRRERGRRPARPAGDGGRQRARLERAELVRRGRYQVSSERSPCRTACSISPCRSC